MAHISLLSESEISDKIFDSACPLCLGNRIHPSSQLLRHLQHKHFKHYVEISDFKSYLCCLPCSNEKTYRGGHYHCPFCNYVNTRKARVLNHYQYHFTSAPNLSIDNSNPAHNSYRSHCILADPHNEIYMVSKTKNRN